MTSTKITRVTEAITDENLRRLMTHRVPFRNSRGTFRGLPLTSADAATLANHPVIGEKLTTDSLLAFSLDVPDYVVFSQNTPIAWHATTRGIDHRKDQSNWRWVVPKVLVWDDYATKRRYNRMVVIVDVLNRR